MTMIDKSERNVKQVGIPLALGGMVLLAGCAGIGGSPELTFSGQSYQDTSFTEAEIGYEGTIANTGDAPAEDVRIELKAELQNGDTYRDVAYLGDIDGGESKEFDVGFKLDTDDRFQDWEQSVWSFEVSADNIEDRRETWEVGDD